MNVLPPKSVEDEILGRHLCDFFGGHDAQEFVWLRGPIRDVSPGFHVYRFAPGPRINLWVYASVGGWVANRESRGIEFLVVAPEPNDSHVELLAMTAHYNRTQKLNWGHTFPIGRPWLEGSACDHILVSLPYLFGPELEICRLNDKDHVHYFWLLPITKAERDFKAAHDLDALEDLFEKRGVQYWDPLRKSLL